MLAFVIGCMATLGLGLTVSQIIDPLKNTKLVVLAVIANFVVVPLFAFGLVWALPVPEGMRIGILLLSIGGGAPFIPKIVEVAKGRVGGAIGLMLLLLIVTMFLMPVAVPMIFSGASVNSWDIAKSLIFTMLVPLVVALFVKARFPDVAARIQPIASLFTNVSVLALVVAVVFLYTETIIAHAGTLPTIILFFLGTMGIGYLAGGKNRDARIIFSVGTGLRNPPIAILVASQNFSTEPMAAITPMIVMIVGSAVLFPLAMTLGRKTQV